MEAFALCDRAYVLFDGRVIAEGTSAELTRSPVVRRYFLGESFRAPLGGNWARDPDRGAAAISA